jgi:peptide/nickel transport system substrate-binding protein
VERGTHARRLTTTAAITALALGLLACARPPAASATPAIEVLLSTEPLEIDPRFVFDAQGLRLSRLLFSGLVTLDPDTLDVIPALAERIDVDADGLRVTAHLRAGLTFSDGSPLDAEDVRATYESVVDPALGSRYRETYRRIARIETPDPATVVFVLDGPHAPFLTDLELPIVRAEDRATHLRAEPGTGGAPPSSSGPCRLVRRTERSWHLAARPEHPSAPVAVELAFTVVRDESTRALRLLGDGADVAPFAIAPLLVPAFESDPRFEVRSAPGPGTAYLAMQTETLADPRVRRALAHALDRAAILASKFGARAELASGFLPTAHWAHVPLTVPGFDPDAARRLLDDAGLPDPPGPAPRLRLVMRTSTDRTRVAIARAMAAMWREVGVEVEVRPSETAVLLADLDAGRFDLALMTLPEVFEPHVLHWFFASARTPGGPPNRFRWASAAFDAALETGRVSVERAERRAAYRNAQELLARELPALPLWHEHAVIVTRRGLGLTAPRDGRLGFLVPPRAR